jgi:hypothetical protein
VRPHRHRAGDQRTPRAARPALGAHPRGRDSGVKFSIDIDAHSVGYLDNMVYGVGTAQRGWLTPDDVMTTWPLARLTQFLRKKA